MDQRLLKDDHQCKSEDYAPITDVEYNHLGIYDKPLPCFGCGIGWFCLLLGFVCPLVWYGATILYLQKYYHKDPRERVGLSANAVAALIFTVAVVITVAAVVF